MKIISKDIMTNEKMPNHNLEEINVMNMHISIQNKNINNISLT